MSKVLAFLAVLSLPAVASDGRFYAGFSTSSGSLFAPRGEEEGLSAVVDGVRLKAHRSEELFSSEKDFCSGWWFLNFCYGARGSNSVSFGVLSYQDVGKCGAYQVIGLGNTMKPGDVRNLCTLGSYVELDIAYNIVYPKFLTWIFLRPLGFAGSVAGWFDPGFVLTLGGAYVSSRLRYSGDMDVVEDYSGPGFVFGVGLEFDISDNLTLGIGEKWVLALGGDAAGSALTSLGFKYYF